MLSLDCKQERWSLLRNLSCRDERFRMALMVEGSEGVTSLPPSSATDDPSLFHRKNTDRPPRSPDLGRM